MNKKKDDQVHFRCPSEEKAEGKRILDEINKSWDFLLTFFVKEFNTASARLQAEIENIDNERETITKQMADLQERMEKLDERRHDAVDELNNISLYDLNNYKNNHAIIGAIGSIKDYVIQRKITNFYKIPNTVFYEINNNFKVHDMELLREISANEFEKWQKELKAADDISDGQKMNRIADNLKDNFNGQKVTKDWKEFIKGKDDLIKRKAKSNGLNPDELAAFLNNKSYKHDSDKRR